MEAENIRVVDQFVDWLLDKIDNKFEHGYVNRKTNQPWCCLNVYDAYEKYEWPFSVGQGEKKGRTFEESEHLLKQLSGNLKDSLLREDNDLCRYTCLKVLEWGGVLRGNREKIEMLSEEDGLVRYLKAVPDKLKQNEYEGVYMNSGFTKIYSLYIENFVIYDSRVGAALGYLVRKFCQESGNDIPDALRFAYGKGRGNRNRNPDPVRNRFPLLSNRNHVENNLKANRLLQKVLSRPSKFTKLRPDNALRALEAALFMIGYQLPDK
ncbi:MAG: hypothetical protein J6K31_01070 [Parabacteroides sp.]|nr:hypothetical protein [Parabacteroides sp.]